MSDRQKRVLVVEDEAEIRQLISLHLRREGFVVVEAEDGDKAIAHLQDTFFELVILDWMLPGRNGLEVTRWMRTQPRFDRTPILFVTAKTDPEHIATGLDAGADDYLPKPFDTIVLMARVHALLRRNQWLQGRADVGPKGATINEIKVGELVLYPDSFESYLHGQKLDLTRSEFRLLEALLSHQGKVLSRESLIEQIQGEGVNVVGRTVDTHVFGLRKKLGEYSELIETIRGVGYRVRFAPQAST
jgi:two-component system, OmpR family, phosphate regulon response regulator PhoB